MEIPTILKKKSKFFLFRALTYFFCLYIPIALQTRFELKLASNTFLMTIYIGFMIGQWFLLGKEIDHRLKIYFKVNSSMDRVLYRLILGMIVLGIIFNLINFMPTSLHRHFFWGIWIMMGLYYSWPTRGKIIQENLSGQLSDFRFLDAFEKILLGLLVLFFIISIPAFPYLDNAEAIKLLLDPLEKINPGVWNFLSMSYFPFQKMPKLYRLALSLHIYLIGMGTYLLAFYALLRFFLSRRLAILGVFSLISTWSYCKILEQNLLTSMVTTFSVMWVWSTLWMARSSTYRSGLFLGLLGLWGTALNSLYLFLMLIQAFLVCFVFLGPKTLWYKRQFLKYSLAGFIPSVLVVVFGTDFEYLFDPLYFSDFTDQLLQIIDQKAFFSISVLGFLLVTLNIISTTYEKWNFFNFSKLKLDELFLGIAVLFVCSIAFERNLFTDFSLLWVVTILALLPLEWIFQAITRLRSRRNLFYLVYILFCLLDSHIEGRFKIFIKYLNL